MKLKQALDHLISTTGQVPGMCWLPTEKASITINRASLVTRGSSAHIATLRVRIYTYRETCMYRWLPHVRGKSHCVSKKYEEVVVPAISGVTRSGDPHVLCMYILQSISTKLCILHDGISRYDDGCEIAVQQGLWGLEAAKFCRDRALRVPS